MRISDETASRARLNRAMASLSADLESLLGAQPRVGGARDEEPGPLRATTEIGRATVTIEAGRIEDYASDDTECVVALPANEYFDDECVSDLNSALGAYVHRHFGDDVGDLVRQIRAALAAVPAERVPRAERRLGNSYGIGQTVSCRSPAHRLILVSATTERTGIGLRAEPHFLYAAVRGIIETMNEQRRNSLVMPVLGSGHGGIPLVVALLFNLLALRTCLASDVGRHIRKVAIVVYEGASDELTQATLDDVVTRAASR